MCTGIDPQRAADHYEETAHFFRSGNFNGTVTLVSGCGPFRDDSPNFGDPPNFICFVYWLDLNHFLKIAQDAQHKIQIKEVSVNLDIFQEPVAPTPNQVAEVAGILSSRIELSYSEEVSPIKETILLSPPLLAALAARQPLHIKELFLGYAINEEDELANFVQLRNSLAANRGLTKVHLRIWEGDPTTHFDLVLEGLISLPVLRSLSIEEFHYYDHEFNDTPVLQQMGELFGRPNLEILGIPGPFFDRRAAAAMANNIKELRLKHRENDPQWDHLELLVRTTSVLEVLELTNDGWTKLSKHEDLEQFGPLIEALKTNTTIEALHLHHNHFVPRIRKAFVSMIQKNQTITSFLWGNPCTGSEKDMESAPETNLMIYYTMLNYLGRQNWSVASDCQACTFTLCSLLNDPIEWEKVLDSEEQWDRKKQWLLDNLYEGGMAETNYQLSFVFEFLSSNLWWNATAVPADPTSKQKQTGMRGGELNSMEMAVASTLEFCSPWKRQRQQEQP